MNPIYAILESPHRWLILAGVSFLAGCIGAMTMLAFAWNRAIPRVWLYLALALTLYFAVRAFLQWKSETEAALAATDTRARRSR